MEDDEYEVLLSILNKGDNIVEYFFSQDKLCQKIFDIKKPKFINKGNEGSIYEVDFDRKKYVMKIREEEELYKVPNVKKLTVKDFAEKNYSNNITDQHIFIKINGGDENKILDFYFVPMYSLDDCKKNYDSLTYTRADNGKQVTLKKSYVCENSYYSESIIGILCAQFYKRKISINFIDIHGFNTCITKIDKPLIKNYIFMEKIDNELSKIMRCIPYDMLPSLYVQIYHAIYTYQTLKISHNDLHQNNIFIKYIDEDTTFDGKSLMNYQYFHYQIGDRDIFTPYIPFIIKIGDFGYSFKYGDPIVGNTDIIYNSYIHDYMPNWFSECYDAVYSTFCILLLCHPEKETDFMKNLYFFIFGNEFIYDERVRQYIHKPSDEKINYNIFRPNIKNLEKNFSHVTPEKLLLNKDIFPKSFYERPKAKYITLGKI
jgi:hypothetical protein